VVYSRSYPRQDESGAPRWVEIFLSAQEEREREQIARQENLYLVRQCLSDARNVIKSEQLMDMQSHVLSIALALFKTRAQHASEYKDELCRQKFEKYWGSLAKKAKPKSVPEPEKKRKRGAKRSSSS
jgi:hypothetical protein